VARSQLKHMNKMLIMPVSSYRWILGVLSLALVKAGLLLRRSQLRSVSPTTVQQHDQFVNVIALSHGPVERLLVHHVNHTASLPIWEALSQIKLLEPFTHEDRRVEHIEQQAAVRLAVNNLVYVSRLLKLESRIFERTVRGMAVDQRLIRKRVGALAVYLDQRYWGFNDDHFQLVTKLHDLNIVSTEEVDSVKAYYEELAALKPEANRETEHVAQQE